MPNQVGDSQLDDALAQSFPASDPLPMNPGTDAGATRHTLFRNGVDAQVALLRAGAPLDAFDAFFDGAVWMYANGELFASGATEGRAKQEPYIAAARSITGRISDVVVREANNVCVFRNRTSFTDANGENHQIDGLSWQRWKDGLVVEERYYDGDRMQQLLVQGILANPLMLLRP